MKKNKLLKLNRSTPKKPAYPKMSVLASEFNASNLSFGELKQLTSGAKAVNLSYDGKPLVMQVSNLDVPYGLNVEDKFGPTKYSFNLSLQRFIFCHFAF